MSLRPAFCMLALCLSATPAFCETSGKDRPVPTDRCQALPDKGTKGDAADKNLSDTLDDCHGVLKPPPTGDGEMSKPAPDVGNTPLVRPRDLPGQQNSK